jgi:two-component system, LuxR family, sensor kinase FixL
MSTNSAFASWYAIGLAAFALQCMLIAALLIQRNKRRHADKLLSASRERLALVSSTATLGFWDWDALTDKVWASAHTFSILGVGPAAALTIDSLLATLHSADRARIWQAIEAHSANEDTIEMELRAVGCLGEIRWIAAKARVYRDSTGTVLRVGGYLTDLSDRKRAEAELLKQREQLTHLARIAILGELSGAIAHELQLPLTAILGTAHAAQHLLASRPTDLEALDEMVESIVADDKRAGDVLQRMRALLTRGETQSQRVDVRDLIGDVMMLTCGTFKERSVQVRTRIAEGIQAMLGDLVGLQQVLLNLLLNACESMSMNDPIDRRIEVVAASEPGNTAVCISVLDRGEGIDTDQLDRIFDPFITMKKNGLGLGLAICRAIIVAHKGRLWAENRSGGGAAFHFTVPVVGANDEISAARSCAHREGPARR